MKEATESMMTSKERELNQVMLDKKNAQRRFKRQIAREEKKLLEIARHRANLRREEVCKRRNLVEQRNVVEQVRQTREFPDYLMKPISKRIFSDSD